MEIEEFLIRVAAGDRSFSDLELNGTDLSGVDLRHIKFPKARLTDVNLQGANLTLVDFGHARLTRVRLSGAHLFKANFVGAHLAGVDFCAANPARCQFPASQPFQRLFACCSSDSGQSAQRRSLWRHFARCLPLTKGSFAIDRGSLIANTERILGMTGRGSQFPELEESAAVLYTRRALHHRAPDQNAFS